MKFWIITMIMMPFAAYAAEPVAAPAPAAPIAVPAALPLPVSGAAIPNSFPPPVSNIFPQLPPSRPCKPGDLWGYYRLEKLYEQPAGNESADFQAAPLQYIDFAADGTYRPLKLSTQLGSRAAFYDKFKRKEGDPLTQYIVHEGFVYFYNEGAAVDTQACFIVESELGDIKKGRMLLMPPAPPQGQQVTTRVLRVYHNFNRPRGRPPHAGANKP